MEVRTNWLVGRCINTALPYISDFLKIQGIFTPDTIPKIQVQVITLDIKGTGEFGSNGS